MWGPRALAALIVLVGGCHRLIYDEGGAAGSDSGSGNVTTSSSVGTTAETSTGPARGEVLLDVPVVQDLDLLFVVDNSSTMGDEQGTLTANAAAFLEILEAAGTNYRIGVTTTDVSAPPCEDLGGNTPEHGALVQRNCREHFGEFASNDGDVFQRACGDHCTVEDIEILPSSTDLDPVPRGRPWIERVGGVTNVDRDVAMDQALACFLPQGVSGCRFESPLEATLLALQRAYEPGDDAYGFVRDDAHLGIVLVTDEVDCSVADNSVFDPNGAKAFWQDRERPHPSSAMCWAAGVSCVGPGPTYSDCLAVNKDSDGNEYVSHGASVIHPISRYLDLLAALQAQKQAVDPGLGVTLAGIVGVPERYPSVDIVYTEGHDDRFRRAFGIGPGCQNDHAEAVPPVRIRDVVELGGDTGSTMVSVCGDDFTPALASIADRIGVGDPMCVPLCVEDGDPAAGLQPTCDVLESWPGGEAAVVPCDKVSGQFVLPAGATACHYYKLGNDRSPACTTDVELGMLRDAPARSGTTWHVTCDVAAGC